MKERTKRLCDSIIALSLAVSVLSSAAAIKTYSARLDVARPGVTAFADGEEPAEPAGDEPTEKPTNEEPVPSVVVYAQVAESETLYPEDGLSVTETDSSFTVNVADLKVPVDTEGGKEGEVFKGWALKAGGDVVTEVGKNSFEPVNDKLVVTLYPVWGAPEPEQTRDGAKGGEGGEGEGGEAQELTEEEKAQKNQLALEKIATVQDAADAAQAELKKENPNKAALVESLNGKDALLDGADDLLKETKGGTNYQLAVSKLATARTALKNAQDAVYALPSAEDKQAVETLNQTYGEIKTLAESAEAAVKANGQITSEYDNYMEEIENLYLQASDILDQVDNAAYVTGQIDSAATAAQNAVIKAQRAYASVVYVAEDADEKRYTWSQLRSHVESLPSNYGAVVDALATIDVAADQKFAKGYKIWWETTSGKKVTFLDGVDADPGDYVYISNLGLGSNTVKSWKCYSYSESSLTEYDRGEIAFIDGTYQARVFVSKEGIYVFAGKYYPEPDENETEDDAIVADDSTGNNGVTKGNLEEDFEKNTKTYFDISEISASDGKYQGIVSKLKGKGTVLAAYDISLKGGRNVLPRKSVTVTLTIPALKGKTIDVYHFTDSTLTNYEKVASGVKVDKNGKFSFTTTSFSPFAFTEATSSSSSSGDSSSTGTGLTSPRTGEGSPLPFVLAAVGALAVAGGVIVWRKKKTAQD